MLDAQALCLQAARELFNLKGDSVDLTFGVVTILTGVVATIVGGVCLDIVGSSLKNAMLLCGECTQPIIEAAWSQRDHSHTASTGMRAWLLCMLCWLCSPFLPSAGMQLLWCWMAHLEAPWLTRASLPLHTDWFPCCSLVHPGQLPGD